MLGLRPLNRPEHAMATRKETALANKKARKEKKAANRAAAKK